MEISSGSMRAVLLLGYVLSVFLISRIVDFVNWYQYGKTATEIVEPSTLNVRQLRILLDNRGIEHASCLEKSDLVNLVKHSAEVLEGELVEINSRRDIMLKSEIESTLLEGASDFREQIKDSEDSVWLVYVMPIGTSSSFAINYKLVWKDICNKLHHFSIKTGVFNCDLDPESCRSRNWNEPLLLLALPDVSSAKRSRIFHSMLITSKQNVLGWVRDKLLTYVHTIENMNELKDWLSPKTDIRNEPIKMMFLSNLTVAPFFLAALSVKFSARVKFGIFSVGNDEEKLYELLKKFDVFKTSLPMYLVVVQNRTLQYGRNKGQHYNFKSMGSFIKTLKPDTNDVFLFSLVLVNMIATLNAIQILVSNDRSIFTIICIFWIMLFYNVTLMLTWVALGSIQQYRVLLVDTFVDRCNDILQYLSLTYVGSLVISDFQQHLKRPLAVLLTFILYGIAVTFYISRYNITQNVMRERRRRQWWNMMVIDGLFRSPALRMPDDMIDAALREMDMWYHSVRPFDYIKELPVWTYQENKSDMEIIKNIMGGLYPEEKQDDWCNYSGCKLFKNNGEGSYCEKCLKSKCGNDITSNLIQTDCSICLDKFYNGVELCGLPCGHSYHKTCIVTWLEGGNHHCPTCRWPPYRYKRPPRSLS